MSDFQLNKIGPYSSVAVPSNTISKKRMSDNQSNYDRFRSIVKKSELIETRALNEFVRDCLEDLNSRESDPNYEFKVALLTDFVNVISYAVDFSFDNIQVASWLGISPQSIAKNLRRNSLIYIENEDWKLAETVSCGPGNREMFQKALFTS